MRKTPRGRIQIGESRTRGVARIPLGLKPSRDSRATSQRDSPIWIQPLGVFRYKICMKFLLRGHKTLSLCYLQVSLTDKPSGYRTQPPNISPEYCLFNSLIRILWIMCELCKWHTMKVDSGWASLSVYQGPFSVTGKLVVLPPELVSLKAAISAIKMIALLGNETGGACQILERSDNSEPISPDFEIEQDFVIRRLIR